MFETLEIKSWYSKENQGFATILLNNEELLELSGTKNSVDITIQLMVSNSKTIIHS